MSFEPNNKDIIDNLEKFEFLVDPQVGVILRFLTSSKEPFTNYPVKIQMLKFLAKIFRHASWFIKKNPQYADTYISYHYISFVKLYNTPLYDSNTLELCKLHMDILISFSTTKEPKVIQKFYQLRVMNFLAEEINLEYLVTVQSLDELNKLEKLNSGEKQSKILNEPKQRERTPTISFTLSSVKSSVVIKKFDNKEKKNQDFELKSNTELSFSIGQGSQELVTVKSPPKVDKLEKIEEDNEQPKTKVPPVKSGGLSLKLNLNPSLVKGSQNEEHNLDQETNKKIIDVVPKETKKETTELQEKKLSDSEESSKNSDTSSDLSSSSDDENKKKEPPMLVKKPLGLSLALNPSLIKGKEVPKEMLEKSVDEEKDKSGSGESSEEKKASPKAPLKKPLGISLALNPSLIKGKEVPKEMLEKDLSEEKDKSESGESSSSSSDDDSSNKSGSESKKSDGEDSKEKKTDDPSEEKKASPKAPLKKPLGLSLALNPSLIKGKEVPKEMLEKNLDVNESSESPKQKPKEEDKPEKNSSRQSGETSSSSSDDSSNKSGIESKKSDEEDSKEKKSESKKSQENDSDENNSSKESKDENSDKEKTFSGDESIKIFTKFFFFQSYFFF